MRGIRWSIDRGPCSVSTDLSPKMFDSDPAGLARRCEVSSVKTTCRIAAVGTARMAPTMPSNLPPISSDTITVTALTPTCRAITLGTSMWFSNCCWTTKKTMTNRTVFNEMLAATAMAGIADRIGPTTGISSPMPEMSAST